jgi:hypothetical protein
MIPLDELDILIEDLSHDPEEEEIYQLYKRFKEDFIDNPLILDDRKIKVILTNSKIPPFRNYPETFVHIITRKSHLSKKRYFELERANRIHWIRNILLQRSDPKIKFFQFEDDKKAIKDHYWFEEGKFMVVLKKVRNGLLIVTAFCVDDLERGKYRRRYQAYRNSIK